MRCPFKIKICNKCKRILVANKINFGVYNSKDGLRNTCKKCRRSEGKKYYQENKETILEKHKEYREENKEQIKEIKKRYYQENKESILEYNKKYKEENKEQIKEKNKKYYETHKEEMSEKRQLYYQENKEQILEKCKKYYKDNPHIYFNARSKRREKEENQGSGISKEQWLEMMDFFEFKCAYSGEYIGGNSKFRTIDHIVPLDKGGEHEIWNLVPMHLSYNSSKRANDMLEWYMKQDFYSEERLNKIYEWVKYAFEKYYR